MRSIPILLALLLLSTGCGNGGGGGGGGAPADPVPDPEPTTWRSALFADDWTPQSTDTEGRFLHDFSYAGYRNGEAPVPTSQVGPEFDVVATFGAPSDGASDATAAIQAAIDAAEAAGGGVVRFPSGIFRVDGLLEVDRSGVVLRGAGPDASRIHFTRHDAMTDRSHLRFRGAAATGAEFLLAVDGVSRETTILVADATGLSVGNDVDLGFTITPEFVAEHGMTGVWTVFLNSWQPFFRREVREIDMTATPHRVTLDVPLRYAAKVRDGASLRVVTGLIGEVGVEDLGLANAVGWDEAWANDRNHILEMVGVKDGWVRNVRSFRSPRAPASGDGAGTHLQSGGIIVRASKRVTVADCRLEETEHRGGGGNGYLFEVRQSSEILFADCFARLGRHNFIQNWGFGTTGCVWLRGESREGEALNDFLGALVAIIGYSEYHHSLATANLVDGMVLHDGWSAFNRGAMSSGAGHTSTECVFWNVTGTGLIRSAQYGHGYVIGTGADLDTHLADGDWLEGEGEAETLAPGSLYEAQLSRRTAGGD